jgi:hypothetical protein
MIVGLPLRQPLAEPLQRCSDLVLLVPGLRFRIEPQLALALGHPSAPWDGSRPSDRPRLAGVEDCAPGREGPGDDQQVVLGARLAVGSRSAAAVASAGCRGDVAAGDAEAGGVFVCGFEDGEQLRGGLVGGAVLFKYLAAGDGEGVVGAVSVQVVARRGGGEAEAVFLEGEREAVWGEELVERVGSCHGNGGGAGAPSARSTACCPI